MKSSINRFRIGTNVFLQTAVVFAILVMVNYFAFNHFKRWDLSRDQKYALSEQTVRVLENLQKPVKLIVYFAGGSDITFDAVNLAREYETASGKRVSVEVLNPYMSVTRAREIASKYKLGGQENVVIIDYDGQNKIVNAGDMAEYEPSLNPMERPLLKAFKGEQALTGALLEVSEQGANKIYVLAGHGEQSPNDPELLGLKTYIERQNVKLEPLRLSDTDVVPEDARSLFIIGPRYDFSDAELSALRAYWERKGRIFILLDPLVYAPKLTAFIESLGVIASDDRVLKTMPVGNVTFVLKDIMTGDFVPGSPITKRLNGVVAKFGGITQSLTIDPDRVKADAIKLQPLITASKGYWAEKRHTAEKVFFDPKEDVASPVVAASIEKGALSDTKIQVESSRMIVVGNSTFIQNSTLTEADLDFVLSGVNWLLDREAMIGITPKAVRNLSLNLTESQLGSLALLTMGAIPGAAAIFGVLSWLKRRR